METPPIRNHPLIPPFLIGIFSLLGLCVVLALSFLPERNVQFVATHTPSPFKYQLLATETVVPTPGFEAETVDPFFSATEILDTETPNAETTPFFLVTQQNGTPPGRSVTPTETLTPAAVFSNSASFTPGKYDDSSLGFTYIGVWNAEENSYAYQETVHVSEEVDDYVAFSFTGTQLMFGYQNSDDAGDVTVEIDGLEETMSQLVGTLWFSYDLEPGTHQVIFTHTGEGPINLDYIEILE